MGCHALVHDGAEAEMARGVNAAQSVIGVPERGSTKLEDVITWAPGRAWFQIYLQQDRSYSLELVDRAIDAGYSAIVLTVDATARADRHRDRANNFSSAHLQRGNIPDGEDERFSAGLNASITLRDVELLSSRAGSTPVIVKGILRSDDARACVDAGARGIIVSNHGGRQLESAIPTAHVLRNVATAVGADAEVFVDGGIRSAEDIVKAVALGARAAMIGRPALWALATEGADGVARLLGDLRDDVTTTMALCGAADVAGLTSDMVA
jgi:4-hydroxymandelate oxidase